MERKSDVVADLIGLACDFNVIQLRIFGGPQRPSPHQRKIRGALWNRLECLADSTSGNSNCDFLLGLRPVELQASLYLPH